MQIVKSIEGLHQLMAGWRCGGERIAFVPTMGNLHEGHLNLVERADAIADRVVVSIYVNPLQFGEGEDLGAYPRTLEADSKRLEALGVDVLFNPTDTVIYPHGREGQTQVSVPGLSTVLCGHFRPGHFDGVATVVAKLFNIVQPHVALFGEKDFQQLMIIRRLVAELNFPIEIIGVATVREANGLAMSSRNGYLSDIEREQAAGLYRTLQEIRRRVIEGYTDYDAVERWAIKELAMAGFKPEYVAIRRAVDLRHPTADSRQLVVLAAAYLGKARLIDNLLINKG